LENQNTMAFRKQKLLCLTTSRRKVPISLCLISTISIRFPLFEVFGPEFTGKAGTYQRKEAIDCTAEAECHSVKFAMSLHLEMDRENWLTLIKIFLLDVQQGRVCVTSPQHCSVISGSAAAWRKSWLN